MRVPFKLKHLVGGRINDLFANPMALAIQDAGIRTCQVHGNGLILWNGGAAYLPPEIKQMHHAMITGDRYEALAPEVHDHIRKLTHQQKGKAVASVDLTPESVLFSFTVAHAA